MWQSLRIGSWWKLVAYGAVLAAAVLAVAGVSVPMFQKNIAEAHVAKTMEDLDTLRNAVTLAEAQGQRVTGLDQLRGRYAQDIPLDPRGRPYQLDPARGELRGQGEDGHPLVIAYRRAAPPPIEPAGEPAPEDAMTDPRADPLSTFSVNVNRASYVRARQQLLAGGVPDRSALRMEEIVNAGRYDDPLPAPGETLALGGEVGPCPWAPARRLVRLWLRAPDGASKPRPPATLVFLVDVSGSMQTAERLPLVRASLELLAENLREDDRIGLVTYADGTGVALPLTGGHDRSRILEAIRGLRAGGSTNGSGGIVLAYQLAREGFRDRGINRVVLATDGDFNVGITDHEELGALIESQARSGVFLSVLGVGGSDGGDRTMELLARRGNGVHAHLDGLDEARRVLVDQVAGCLQTVARDVKVQVAFDPERVAGYRLVGFTQRRLAHEDFARDAKDACEINTGHTVTALYEVLPRAGARPGRLLELRVRHQPPAGGPSRLATRGVVDAGAALADMSRGFRLAAALALFGRALTLDAGAAEVPRIEALLAGVPAAMLPPDFSLVLRALR